MNRPRTSHRLVVVMAAVGLALSAVVAVVSSGTDAEKPKPVANAPLNSPTLRGLAFATAQQGWVGIDSSSGGSGQLLGTTDGGKSFRIQWQGALQPTQLQALGGNAAVALTQSSFSCAQSPDLRSCRSEVLVTDDGGATWTGTQSLARRLVQISFSTPQLGLAAVQGYCAYGASSCPGAVLLTEDGGEHWRQVLATPGPVESVLAEDQSLFAMSATLGSPGGAAGSAAGLQLLESSDLGQSWRQVGTIPPAYYGQFVSLQLTAQLLASAPGRLWLGLMDQASCAMQGCGTDDLLYSGDGGTTWVERTPPIPDSSRACGTDTPASDFAILPGGSVAAASQTPTAGCGPPTSTISLSESSPQEGWGPVHTFQTFAPEFLSWPAASVGYAASAGSLIKTSDGGARWTQLLPGRAPTAVLDPLSSTLAFGAGQAWSAGVVTETRNGGRSWRVLSDLHGQVSALSFQNASVGYATVIGEGAADWQLYRTGDGGRNWTKVTSMYNQNTVLGPWVYPSGRLLVVGALGHHPSQTRHSLWESTRAGADLFPGPGLPRLKRYQWFSLGSFDISDRLRAALASDAPKDHFYLTSDAGRSWERVRAPARVEGIAAVGGAGLWAWSYSGPATSPTGTVLWYSSDDGRSWDRVTLAEPLSRDAVFGSFSFVSAKVGWTLPVSSSPIERSVDGGRRWIWAGSSVLP